MNRSLQFALLLGFMSGCTFNEMPPEGSIHVNTVEDVLTLVAPRPGLTALGNDYLFIAPVSIWYTRGTRHFLWLGLGSTIDRELTGLTAPLPEDIILMVDEIPMDIEIKPWSEFADTTPYDVNTPLYSAYGARMTLSQLDRIASAQNVQAEISSTVGQSTNFTPGENDNFDWSDVGVVHIGNDAVR